MSFTNAQAEQLIQLPKKVIEGGQRVEEITLEQKFPWCFRVSLATEQDDDVIFLLEVNQSAKNSIRISLHYQDQESKIGLLRVDFNGGHKNPTEVNQFVPEKLKSFAGKIFQNEEHHRHVYVQGYRNLAWAIPLTDDEFPITELAVDATLNRQLDDIIHAFCDLIKVKTTITINRLLL